MLYVHIPSLHPANYPDLEVSSAVQTAAVMGIGLLYLVCAYVWLALSSVCVSARARWGMWVCSH